MVWRASMRMIGFRALSMQAPDSGSSALPELVG
jgi:hypothetical protein